MKSPAVAEPAIRAKTAWKAIGLSVRPISSGGIDVATMQDLLRPRPAAWCFYGNVRLAGAGGACNEFGQSFLSNQDPAPNPDYLDLAAAYKAVNESKGHPELVSNLAPGHQCSIHASASHCTHSHALRRSYDGVLE